MSPSVAWRLVGCYLLMADSRSGHPQRARNYTTSTPYYKPFSDLFLPDVWRRAKVEKSIAYERIASSPDRCIPEWLATLRFTSVEEHAARPHSSDQA